MVENTLPVFLENLSNEVATFIASIDEVSINKARDLIFEAERNHGRVHVTGIGKPGHVSGYISSLLSSTGTPAYILHGTEAVHGSSGQVLEGDVVIAISNSGETKELKATVETLKANGAKIIGVSGNVDSYLKNSSDIFLFAGVKQEGDCLNKAPRASILAETIVLQSLSVALQYAKGLDAQQYLKWHPGGSLGKSIREGM
ncbi:MULTISPECIES: SIS domain-containing protein [unclassified Clostridioides]|uniref:SIS domain-containing protein n=1 Tax=unclassified Clostridioides TaxID=2635829 RepID=UPI001D0F98B6|nr:SIS domain-containing protein [Clostridioides sp. ZZV14-6150]MCC0661933.1 SIS domain-containing protein [Clostridioides sp. ZZV14-6154]MCC0663052.1 SIS domain-containing protein [Clostridioides sp. ZZV15-6597]MCC0670024.1 SIS domain-containing protein [Clostridioides sp. ZZV14-6153]MCC0719205.1 SIS domain-containing protein [Clostridioides sp. ZZV14-6105]MCC0724032.1 SIS domain-containing protein [Clostridioides sp. ZZV14-6104]MCC0726129.1 SIS domain-containing protein [Clostridioides sp. 